MWKCLRLPFVRIPRIRLEAGGRSPADIRHDLHADLVVILPPGTTGPPAARHVFVGKSSVTSSRIVIIDSKTGLVSRTIEGIGHSTLKPTGETGT